jgi:hypothetical protein
MKRFNDYFAMSINERINLRAKYPYNPNILCSKSNGIGLLNQIRTNTILCIMYVEGRLNEINFRLMHNKENRNKFYNF